MRERLPLVLSAGALIVSLLGATPLGRAAYATVIPRNSVGTLQLKRNAVTASKIAPNAIRTGQVVDGSLLTADFKPGQIPQGPKGDKGDRGPAGPTGVSGYEIVRATATVNADTLLIAAQATCPAGKKVLGGAQTVQGTSVGGVFFNPFVQSSGTGTNDIYSVSVFNSNTTARQVIVQAICAKVAG